MNLIYAELATVLVVPVALSFALWTGWLVAFADRKAGPIRLFLDGLLLPAATITVIGLSAGKIQPSRLESAVSSESRPVTLRPPSSDKEAESSGNGSESTVPQSSGQSEGANETSR